jgi:hypothetical protein
MEDCQPSNQDPVEATPNNPIQTIVIYQPPRTMDDAYQRKTIFLQEISCNEVKQIVPSDVDVIGVDIIP